ncbi:MAG: hypothetical protein K5Q68_01970 [Roseococcus sp.]|nr:hypothetical protein [Roseococcus sp.]
MRLSLFVFMAGSLLEMGLGLSVKEALKGLRNRRFLAYGVVYGLLLGPVLAWLLTRIIPLDEPYAVGLLMLGMAPCAPFLPALVKQAHGDMAYVPAMLLLTALGTVAMMTLAAPLLLTGLTLKAWTIARPLVFMVLLPLLLGMLIFGATPRLAVAIRPAIRRCAAIAAVVLLVLCLVLYGRGFASSFGSFAIGTQFLFLGLLTAASYDLSPGLGQAQRSVMALGLATRNVGAAIAPLLAAPDVDPRTIVMVALGVPVQIAWSLMAAAWFARAARPRR